MAHSALASSRYVVLQARAKHAVHPSPRCAAPHCRRTALQGPAASRGQQCRPQVPPLALSAPCLRGCASGGTDSAGGPSSALVVKNWSVSVTCRHQRGRQGAQQVERPFKAVPAHTPTTSRHLSTSLNDAKDATGRVRGSGAASVCLQLPETLLLVAQLKCRPQVAGPLLPCHAALCTALCTNLRLCVLLELAPLRKPHAYLWQAGREHPWVGREHPWGSPAEQQVGGRAACGREQQPGGQAGLVGRCCSWGAQTAPRQGSTSRGRGGVHYSPRRGTG